jgi:pimeloyl-ACP methyl ester carboxylesterase
MEKFIYQSEEIPEEENREEKEDIYKQARERADFCLENFNLVNKEDIIEINPEKVKDETPVLFSPGWGIKDISKSIMELIAKEDRRVISTFFSREEKLMESGSKEDIPVAELQKAMALIEVIKDKGIDKVDAIGHSEGGLNLVIAACLYPEKFRNIVLIAPAGMMGKDSPLDLAIRFLKDESIEEIKNKKGINMNSLYSYIKDVIIHTSKNLPLVVKEVKAMTSIDIFEMTKYLKEKGVGVGLVCGANDKVFPIEEVMKNMGEKNVDYFISTKSNHGSLVFNKEYVSLAENLLVNMAKKKE